MADLSLYHFCPRCAGDLAWRPFDPEGHQRRECQRCSFVLYQNSVPCASALVVRDGKVLLVERAIEPFKGWWDIPGGFLENGEHPEDGARRELREETGLEVRLTRLLGIFMDIYADAGAQVYTLNLFYLAEAAEGTPRPGSDASGLGWFRKDELPERVAFQCCRDALAAWKETSGGPG